MIMKLKALRIPWIFGRFVMNDENFCSGNFDTDFISNKLDDAKNGENDVSESMLAAIVSYKYLETTQIIKKGNAPTLRTGWQKRTN